MTRDEIKLKLEVKLSPKRFIHSINVMYTSIELAKRFGADVEKAALAGLLHDCARDIRGEEIFNHCNKFGIQPDDITRLQPELLHGSIGKHLTREQFEIEDREILDAIDCHTMGKEHMSALEKVVFIADYIEPGRNFPGVNEVRKAADTDINLAMVMSLDKTVLHVMSKGALIHPDTIKARNSILKTNGDMIRRLYFNEQKKVL